jgi:hypothetical protein
MSFHDDPRDFRDSRERWDDPYEPNPWDRRLRPAAAARSMVLGPAIILLVLAVFNALGGLAALSYGAILQSIDTATFEDDFAPEPDDLTGPDPPPDSEDAAAPQTYNGMSADQAKACYVAVGIALGLGCLLAAAILGAGGILMLRLKFYWLVVLAAITAMLSPGGGLAFGLLGGVWSLVVLFNPDVRKAFT